MTEAPQSTRLSIEGEQRRRAIGQSLIRRTRNRRIGRATLAAAACFSLLGAAGLLARAFVVSPSTPRPEHLAHNIPSQVQPAPHTPTALTAPALPTVRIMVVTNEPIPEQPCSQAAAAPATQVPVCILNDQQLLSALSATGESYGLVRIGGRTMVVSNTAH